MTFSSVYPCSVTKVEKKGRTEAELREVLTWLTGLSSDELDAHREAKSSFADLFQAAELHENATLITGSICGYRIEELDIPLTKSVRMMDKLLDELAAHGQSPAPRLSDSCPRPSTDAEPVGVLEEG